MTDRMIRPVGYYFGETDWVIVADVVRREPDAHKGVVSDVTDPPAVPMRATTAIGIPPQRKPWWVRVRDRLAPWWPEPDVSRLDRMDGIW